jgi:hypothetical protein
MTLSVREGIIDLKSYQKVNTPTDYGVKPVIDQCGGCGTGCCPASAFQRTEVIALRFCAQASGVEAPSIGRDLP